MREVLHFGYGWGIGLCRRTAEDGANIREKGGKRIRLLATFRLPPLYTQTADEDPRGPCPAHAGAEEQALQVFRPTTAPGIMVAETGTTATVVHRFHTRGNPALVVLDKETDLTASPLPVCVGAGGALSPSCRTQRQITAGAADNDAAVMNDALATLAGVGPEAIDFVSSSQTMKIMFLLLIKVSYELI